MADDSIRRIGDAVGYVRANPARFFPEGKFTAVELAAYLVREALQYGASSVEVARHEEWIIVHSPEDWLGADGSAAFRQIIPAPQIGQNAMRVEILATAFAKEVLTKINGRVEHITGIETPSALARYANRGRAVAFAS
jgi:hypothetical protein